MKIQTDLHPYQYLTLLGFYFSESNWHLVMVYISIALMINEVEHHFFAKFPFAYFSLLNCLFNVQAFANSLFGCFITEF